jgi:hypothetical protein
MTNRTKAEQNDRKGDAEKNRERKVRIDLSGKMSVYSLF